MKTILSLIIIWAAGFGFADTAKSKNEKDKKTLLAYQNKCVKEAQRPLDIAQKLCSCVTTEMSKKVSMADLEKLLVVRPQLSEEDATKVENVNEDIYTLEELEFQVAEDCEKSTQSGKK